MLTKHSSTATRLSQKLIVSNAALNDFDMESWDSSTDQAVLALKRARRGPFRSSGQDDKSRRRDAGWLQRRGFRMDAIKSALDIDPLRE